MVKLTLILLAAVAVAACLLQLRQQRTELGFQTQRLHRQIQSRQAELWNQQVQIASYTSPRAIAATTRPAEPVQPTPVGQ